MGSPTLRHTTQLGYQMAELITHGMLLRSVRHAIAGFITGMAGLRSISS